MYLRKRGFQQRNIRKKDSGQAEWALGMFLLLILSILLLTQLQLASWRTTSLYLEDALASSNLASALIDVEEYGKSHRVVIADPSAAYAIYCSAVKENLQLDGQWQCHNKEICSGTVEIADYIVYNVEGDTVTASRVGSQGTVKEEWQGTKGILQAPNGITVECTGIYSEITFPVDSFLGLTVQAHKGNLADIRSKSEDEE